MENPLESHALCHIGPVPVAESVVVTWALMALLVLGAALATRRLTLSPSKGQVVLEMLVSMVDDLIRDTMNRDPASFRALIGTLLVFVLTANWSGLLPGVEPPTSHLETDAALAMVVFIATIAYGIRARGLGGYLATFAEPSWVMIPLNVIEQITRAFSLMVRLFGNVMSGVFIAAIVLSLAGLLVPIPFMALDLLTGAIQAYIFAVLATVFIGAAAGEGAAAPPADPNRTKDP